MLNLGDMDPNITRSIALTALAGLGGALSYVWRTTRAGRKLYFFRILLSSTLVAFICFHLGFVYQELGLSEHMIWALNGFTAVIGVEGLIFMISKLAFKFLKVSENDLIIKELLESGWTPPPGSSVSGMERNARGEQGPDVSA